MNTKEMTGEQISAFADGECADSQVERTLAELRNAEGKAAWEIYHQIGDVLRSDDIANNLSPDFSARMAARLEAEPTIVAPVFVANDATGATVKPPATHAVKRWALPGMFAAAAAAAAAFFTTPHLMVAGKSESPVLEAPAMAAASVDAEQASAVAAASQGIVLRDAGIDDYLLAHQQFSPSVYSAAQYARSATFATGSNK